MAPEPKTKVATATVIVVVAMVNSDTRWYSEHHRSLCNPFFGFARVEVDW